MDAVPTGAGASGRGRSATRMIPLAHPPVRNEYPGAGSAPVWHSRPAGSVMPDQKRALRPEHARAIGLMRLLLAATILVPMALFAYAA